MSKPFRFTEPKKLNQTIFADSPDWAEWAAVDASGVAYVYQRQPILDYRIWVAHGGHIYSAGYFDAADWKNSLIRRVRQDDEAIRFDMSVGRKLDQNKPRFSLIPHTSLTQLMAVLEYGARKYEAHNWRQVSDGKTRYADAAMRHFLAWQAGETLDAESGLPHLAHALTNLMFLCELDD